MLRHLVRLATLMAFLFAAPAIAHQAPFSYLDLEVANGRTNGTLTVHVIDAAFELTAAEPRSLLDPDLLARVAPALEARLAPRLRLGFTGPLHWTGAVPLPDEDALRLTFRVDGAAPGALSLNPVMFPYDPLHQTFVNVYEGGKLRQQFIFTAGSEPRTYYRGTTRGALAVMRTFIPAGTHHILIGPDHLLFLFGLLLLGGAWRKLALIVTAFTLGHSVTLSLAALDIVNLPASVVEPAIALSIVVIGVDNLLQTKNKGRDVRAAVAAIFGLMHGFGFATALKQFGLPQEALGWSLFSFNVGVELGQLAVMLVVAAMLAVLARRNTAALGRVETIGSIAVIAGGAYWFVERVFFGGAI